MAMENALKEVLTRAQRWGAVMLIDEADVYIRRREKWTSPTRTPLKAGARSGTRKSGDGFRSHPALNYWHRPHS